jgi:hypothetical protein
MKSLNDWVVIDGWNVPYELRIKGDIYCTAVFGSRKGARMGQRILKKGFPGEVVRIKKVNIQLVV